MNLKHLVLHVILNLPEKEAAPTPTSTEPATEPAGLADDWGSAISSLVQAAEGTSAPAPVLSPPTPTPRRRDPSDEQPGDAGVPWAVVTTSGSSRAWRRIGRTAFVVVIVFFAWVGFRTSVFDQEPTAPGLPVTVTFDRQSAQAAAQRLVTVAYSWNEADPKPREAAIGLDYAGGASPLGWNGKGRQDVLTVIPGTVSVLDADSALVTVHVQVLEYTREAKDAPWTAGTAQWVTVTVPVAYDNDHTRMVVTAAPVLTGEIAPVRPATKPAGLADADLTATTEDYATAFFTAYGEGDTQAVQAPNARIVPPTSVWRLSKVSSWSVQPPVGDQATATATVVWATDGSDAELSQTYSLVLTRVSAAGAARWQVATITAG